MPSQRYHALLGARVRAALSVISIAKTRVALGVWLTLLVKWPYRAVRYNVHVR